MKIEELGKQIAIFMDRDYDTEGESAKELAVWLLDKYIIVEKKEIEQFLKKPNKSKVNKNPLTQFEIYTPYLGYTRPPFPMLLYRRLVSLTRLSEKNGNISYEVNGVFFTTRSQGTLNKVNKMLGTDFQFTANKRVMTLDKVFV